MKLKNDHVDNKLIGEIIFRGSFSRHKIRHTLLNGKFETIHLAWQPSSLISLPNGNLVCGTNLSVMLLDANLREIKNIATGGFSFCALNHRNEINVSVHHKHCIILFDSNLNRLKAFGLSGSGNNQLYCPFGLCCHDDYVYICDYSNRRIQILSLDLEYVNTIQLDGNTPIRIQTSETTIGVSCDEAILFYNLKTRALKYKYGYNRYNLDFIDSTFYASKSENKKFYFDSDGNFVEEITINENLKNNGLTLYKDNLYMVDYYSNKFLKFTN